MEIVRANFEAWNARDMDAWGELFDPAAIMRNPEGWPEPGPQVGREAVVRFIEQLRDTWDADTLEVIGDFIDAADRIVVRFIWHGAGSGPDADLEMTGVYTVRKGRIFGLEFFWDHAEALETLGLPERAASQDNVEIVRQAWKAYTDRGIGAALDYYAEDCVVEDFPEMPDRATYVGREGVRERDRHFAEIWGDFVIEPVQLINGGGDVVVVTVAIRGHGKGSGAPIDAPTAFLYELRDGKIVRDRAYTSKSQALQAVGLDHA